VAVSSQDAVSVFANLRYSARSFTRAPGLALALLVTIALGIGSNASVLGFVRGSVARDRPIPELDSIVSLFGRDQQGVLGPVSYDTYITLAQQLDGAVELGAARELQAGVVLDERSSIVSVAAVTPPLARFLQLALDDGVVISRHVWQTSFSEREDVSGSTVRLDGPVSTVTHISGVAPEWLEGLYIGRAVDLWVPLQESALQLSDRGSRTCWVLGRLRDGVSIQRARAMMSALLGADAIVMLPYTGMTPDTADGLSRIDWLLRAAGVAVFFIACANVASFLLARASARSLETSVRVALGARRVQLITQLLSDSVLISIAGGAFGLLFAVWTEQIVPALFFDQDAEHLVFAPDRFGIVSAAAACAAITIVCGLIPFFELRADRPAAVLQREGVGPSPTARQLRAGLVVAQTTACCLLVFAASLLLVSVRAALRTNANDKFGQPLLATLETNLRYVRPELGQKYFLDAERVAMALPEISFAAWMAAPPGSRPAWQSVRVEPSQMPLRDVVMDVAAFTPQSLALVTLPPIAGRMFSGGDTPDGCKVAIVNDVAARDLFDGDAIGRSIEDPAGDRVQIVGVVGVRQTAESNAHERPTIFYYADQTAPPVARGRRGDGAGTEAGIFRIRVRPPLPTTVLDANVVSPGYFEAMDVRAVAGALFTNDLEPEACRVAVINEEASERYFGGHALGAAIVDAAGRRIEIAGVVHAPPLGASQRKAEPAMYLPMAQEFRPRMTLLLGARDGSDRVLGSVRRALEAVPGGTGVRLTTLDAHLSRTALASERIASVLVAASAATALTLGVLGLYAAMAEAVRQRRREIALRIALGAPGWRVIRQVVVEGLQLAAVGIVAGTLGSLVAVRWLGRIAPGADMLSVWVWAAAPAVMLGAVAVASVIPARRALTSDPLTIMRNR
jgi:predicted permease